MNKYTGIILLSTSLFFFGCSSSINVISEPSQGKITIDGNTSEWNNLHTLKNQNIAFGFKNDNEFMYISMVTNDRNKIMKILTGGLDIWLGPNDSDNKIGIKYPERPDPADIMKLREERRNNLENGDNQAPPSFLATQNTLGIMNKDGKVLKEFPISGNTYQAKINLTREEFSYELRIPIGEILNSPEGLKIKPGENVAVEFITGSLMQDMPRRRDDGGMGMYNERDGRMGGERGPGGEQQGPGGMRTSNSGPLDYNFNVKLH